MASYEQTVKNICERDVITAYTDVLTDINYCINLFANLETKQTFTEFLMDWYAGERVQINTESFLIDLNNLKEEIQSGIKLYIELFGQIKVFKSLLTIYDSNSESIGYSNKSTARFEFIQRLRSQFEALLLAIQYIETPKECNVKMEYFGTYSIWEVNTFNQGLKSEPNYTNYPRYCIKQSIRVKY
ncbi:hypothetical protein LOD99_9852 [Oopsacas minuta]|uniref:Uncharacterized protein n=1 Tax=Oopsacas minuta TaxID=111878 RepID=A0AAV7KLG8_9METZ|nr:hypothetical protein LOD99_9852 [Oopsacas minuta]